MDRVVFPLEAFEPLIVGCLNVMDLVPRLAFIDDIEVFRERHRQSPREAVTYLIQTIKNSNEPGKWQAFLEALKAGASGYDYIAKLLLEKTEEDHAINRKILRLLTPELITRIDPEEFIDHLLEEDLIGETDREEIQCEKRNRGDIAASLLLLERVPRRLENWPDLFIKVLEKCGLQDLVDNFRVPEISLDHISANGGDYYITPYEDEDTKYKMSTTNHPRKGNNSSCFIDKYEYDVDIKMLIDERNMLEKKVKKEREIRKLKSDVERLKAELEESGDRDNMSSDVKLSSIKDYPSDTNKDAGETNKNSNTKAPTESRHNGRLRKEVVKDTTVIPIPEDANHLLTKIASGVEGIREILKEMRDGDKENAFQDVNKQKNNLLNDNGSIVMPQPHVCNGNATYVPINKPYLQLRSFDSAISVGYVTSNVEQYV